MILLLGLWTFVRVMTLGSAAIALENVALRHQLAVLQRSVRRPQFHRWDRAFFSGPLAMVAKLASQPGDRPARDGHLVAPPGV